MEENAPNRVIEESVPGKQVTLAHVIASPIPEVYESLGIEAEGAIGILTITPCETAIIAADVAGKNAEVNIGFLDRFTGSVLISGDVQSVEVALTAVVNVFKEKLGYDVAPVSKT